MNHESLFFSPRLPLHSKAPTPEDTQDDRAAPRALITLLRYCKCPELSHLSSSVPIFGPSSSADILLSNFFGRPHNDRAGPLGKYLDEGERRWVLFLVSLSGSQTLLPQPHFQLQFMTRLPVSKRGQLMFSSAWGGSHQHPPLPQMCPNCSPRLESLLLALSSALCDLCSSLGSENSFHQEEEKASSTVFSTP